MDSFLGLDVGSVSTNIVLMDAEGNLLYKHYLKTRGNPAGAIQNGFEQLSKELGSDINVMQAATTGSGRHLALMLTGADLEKNEITSHAVASIFFYPDVKTIIEIGGQDSKIIIVRDGVAVDFAMNTICAAGTGSFIEQQCGRLGMTLDEFGSLAQLSQNSANIAGRCAVFAETDMIHKQQQGYSLADIVAGCCDSLVRNYLNNVCKGKEILDPIVFQGGVAANTGIVAAFKKILEKQVLIPEHYEVMGAFGAALLARKQFNQQNMTTTFKGCSRIKEMAFQVNCFTCGECVECCQVERYLQDGVVIGASGDRCKKWSGK